MSRTPHSSRRAILYIGGGLPKALPAHIACKARLHPVSTRFGVEMKLHTSLFSVGSVKGVGFEPEYISLPKRNLTLPTRVSNPTSDYMQRRCCWQELNLLIRVHIGGSRTQNLSEACVRSFISTPN